LLRRFGQAAQAHVDEKTRHRLVTEKNPPAFIYVVVLVVAAAAAAATAGVLVVARGREGGRGVYGALWWWR